MKFSRYRPVLVLMLPLVVMLLTISNGARAQTLATVGDDFWLGFMHNTGSSNEELRLFITSETPTSGTVEIPLMGWSTNFSVIPNTTTTVIVPLNLGETITNDQVDTKGIHVTTNDPVSLFGINFSVFSADASKILPSSSLGTDYVVSAYRGITGFSRSEFLIVATEDNTELEINPSVTTQGGNAAGVPYTILLNSGETYQVRSNATTGDLTGTRVTGTDLSGSCRPFAIFSGAQCANVPTTCTTCDHLFDQQFPLHVWGSQYLIPPFQSTGVYTYRVLARDNNTQVSVDGGAPQVLNAGQFLEVNDESLPREVTANAPIQVMQFMQGDNCSLNGDPAMLTLNANNQQISYVTFSTVASTVITNHFLNLVVQTSNIGSVLLDNTPIPATSFAQFPSNPSVSYAQVPVNQGSHTLYALNGFTGYLYGMGQAESYAYSLGSYLEEPVLTVDSVICSASSVALVPPINLFQPEWTALSDTNTVLSTSNSLFIPAPITTDVYTVSGVSPISGCPDSFTFSVSGQDSFALNIFTDEDTVCAFNTIQAHVDVSTSGFYEYEWWPSFAFTNPSNDSTQLVPATSGWYGVTVSNFGGNCIEISDSVYIQVIPGNIQSVSVSVSDSLVCFSDTVVLEAVTNELLFFDEFNGASISSLWNGVAGSTLSASCGSVTGNALFFNGAPTRSAETVDLDVGAGGQLEFYIKVADGIAPCDDANFGENIILEYSTNGGTNWNAWTTLFEFNYPTATLVSLPIPLPAQTPATRFRWSQPNFTGVNQDVWWLDNVLVTGTSSNSSLQYSWTPTAGVSSPQSSLTELIPTTSGWYYLEVGSGNCSYEDSIFIQVAEPFTIDLIDDMVLCGNQAADLHLVISGNQNVQVAWEPLNVLSNISSTQATVSPNTDTTIYVTVTEPSGCFNQTDSATIANLNATVNITGDSLICSGASSTLTASIASSAGLLSLTWYENGVPLPTGQPVITVTPGSTSTYIAELQDVNGICSWSDTFEVVVNQFSVNAGQDEVLCETEGYVLAGSTNAQNPTIIWSPSVNLSNSGILQPTILTNTTATYTLNVSDGICSYFDDVTITYSVPNMIAIPEDTALCMGESLTFDYSGAQNVVWTPGTGITTVGSVYQFDPLTSTTYIVDYSTSNNCAVSDTMNVNLLQLPSVSLPPDITLCFGEELLISPAVSPSGGIFNWNTTANTSQITVDTGGLYWLEYTTQCGTVSDSIQVNYYAAFSVSLGNDTTVCAGDSLDVTATGSGVMNYTWNNNTNGVSTTAVSPELVIVVADDGNGCTQTDSLNISAFPALVSGLPPFVQVCQGDSILLDASGAQAQSYLWNTGATTSGIYVSNPGVYNVSMLDVNGCVGVDSVSFSTWQVLEPIITGPVDYCSNEDVAFNVQNTFAGYQWSTGSSGNSTLVSGVINEISIETTDLNGCLGYDTLALFPVIVPDLDLGSDIVLCDTQTLVLDGTTPGATDYLWEPINSSSPVVDVLPGAYQLTVFINHCSTSDDIVISVEPYTLELGDDQYLCRDQPVFLVHSLLNIDSLNWYDGTEGNSFHLNTEFLWEDSILISATAYGCDVQTDSVMIYLQECECNIFIPNSFTPNDDEFNQTFKVYQECPMALFEFRIFNRWGEAIFESNDPNFEWNGQLINGTKVQQGTYTWQLRFLAEFDLNSDYREMVGHINVLH